MNWELLVAKGDIRIRVARVDFEEELAVGRHRGMYDDFQNAGLLFVTIYLYPTACGPKGHGDRVLRYIFPRSHPGPASPATTMPS